MTAARELYLGLISGTSADGIDAALVEFDEQGKPNLLGGLVHPWPADLREQILAVAQDETRVDLDTYGRLDVAIGHCFADAAKALMARHEIHAGELRAIGSHGQTLRHRPLGAHPFTLQLGDATVIAERCHIDTVADFRRADIAAGGQGAPLVPAFHATVLRRPGAVRVVLNLGGIANITVLDGGGHITGFDTGPANGLMDAWCLRHRGEAFDRDGDFARSGSIDASLLQAMLSDEYFAMPPPKSTGREHFHLAWLESHPALAGVEPAAVQATLLELSALSIVDAITQYAPLAVDVVACGGGVHNAALMQRLGELLAGKPLRSSAELGIDPDFVEAMAFAWLARQRLNHLPGNLPAVTGARGPRVLGAWHVAGGQPETVSS
jgi:anhydro-N-acetylmuramic acid kinase